MMNNSNISIIQPSFSQISSLIDHFTMNRLRKGIHFDQKRVKSYQKKHFFDVQMTSESQIIGVCLENELVAYGFLEKLEWDSDIFDANMWSLNHIVNIVDSPQLTSLVNLEVINGIREWSKINHVDFLVSRIDTENIQLIQDLNSNGFEMVETILWMSQKIASNPSIVLPPDPIVSIRIATLKDVKVIKQRVSGLFSESRFYKERYFERKAVDSMYEAWIENSFENSNEKLFVAVVDKNPAGFWISKQSHSKNEFGQSVGIGRNAAVFPEYRGKAVLKRLANYAISQNEGFNHYDVSASIGNYPSLNSLTAVGFKIVYSFHTFHLSL
jgi:hypothetical protein